MLGGVGRWIRELYATADLRSLGLFRLVSGLLLMGNNLRHWVEAPVYYSNAGVLKNHFVLFHPFSGYNLSVYSAFSSLAEVHVAFALSFCCFFFYAIGYKTRLFALLSFVLVASLDNRLVMVENGGYVVLNLVVLWGVFLPVGRRFSLDAWLESFRERKERTPAELGTRFLPRWKTTPWVSTASLLVTLNLAVVYLFNVVNKSGAVWRRGETVHYVLHIDRMITGVAVFFREILPYPLEVALSWAVLSHEALLFALILAPYGRRITRPLAIVGIWLLHGTFGVMMRLGPFSWFMCTWGLLLLTRENWEALERWHRRRATPTTVLYDRSALGFFLARVLCRMDGLGLLTLRPAEGAAAPLLATEGPDGEVLSGRAALPRIAACLPAGREVFGALRVLSLGLVGPAYSALERRREAVARFFGLAAPENDSLGAPSQSAPEVEPSALRAFGVRQRVRLREAFLVYFTVTSAWQAINENKSIPPVVKTYLAPPWIPKPLHEVMVATIQYPRLFQGWNMFSPNPITEDGVLTIDAITKDGRHIDPLTGKAPILELTKVRGAGLTQIAQDYGNRIRLDRNKPYRQGLSEYLQVWHQRTGRPEDELVAFDVYWVKEQCPAPDQDEPYKDEKIALLTWRRPKFTPPPGFPEIPPPPKVESAGD
jgi:hypothetical protein